jgi:integrase
LLAATGARFSQLAQLKVANLQIDNKRLMLPVSRKGSRGKSQVPIAYPLRDEVIAA